MHILHQSKFLFALFSLEKKAKATCIPKSLFRFAKTMKQEFARGLFFPIGQKIKNHLKFLFSWTKSAHTPVLSGSELFQSL